MINTENFNCIPKGFCDVITFGEFCSMGCQEDILTLISKTIQEYVEKGEMLPVDQDGSPVVQIDRSSLGKGYRRVAIWKAISEMYDNTFSFRSYEENYTYLYPIFKKIVWPEKSKKIQIYLNSGLLRFLESYGERGYGTNFPYDTALSLRGKYTKRIYKIFSSSTEDNVEYPLNQFRKDFKIPKSYTTNRIIHKILRPAANRIWKANSIVWLAFTLESKDSAKGQKPKIDTITISIHKRLPGSMDKRI